jgi:hypothetical protein
MCRLSVNDTMIKKGLGACLYACHVMIVVPLD